MISANISGSTSLLQSGGNVLYTGNNTFTGDFYAQAGLVGIGSNTVLGTGTISMGGATFRGEGGQWTLGNFATMDSNPTFAAGNDLTFSGVVNLTGGRTITVSAFDTITFSGSVGDIFLVNNFAKSGIGILQITGTWDTGGTFYTNNQGGTILIDGAAGAVVNTSGITVSWGSTIQFDNTAANNNNRLRDEATLALNGGSLVFIGNASTPTNEIVGPISLSAASAANTSSSTIVMDSEGGASNPLTVQSPSFVENNTSLINFVGEGSILGTAGNQLKFITTQPILNTVAPVGIIGNALLTTVLPTAGLIGLDTATTSVDFATYLAATGVGIASETDNINAAGGGNVKLSSADSNVGAGVTLTGSATINALLVVGNVAVAGAQALTVASGFVASASNSISGFATSSIAANLTLGVPAAPQTATAATEQGNETVTAAAEQGAQTITAASEVGNTVTITAPCTYALNEAVTIAGVTPLGYNGSYIITSVGTGTFSYVNPTSGLAAATAFGTATANTVTVTAPGTYMVGQTVTIAGFSPTTYNGTFTVLSVGTGTFSYWNPNPVAYQGAPMALGTANVNTVTVTVPGTYAVGEQVTLAGFTAAGYNATAFITSVGSGTFTYTSGTASMAAATVFGTVVGTNDTIITSNNAIATYSGAISAANINVGGRGTTVLSGNSSAFYGNINVLEGVLNAQGFSSTVNPLGNGLDSTITAAASASTVETITAAGTYYVGETVNITGMTPTGYNGQYTVTVGGTGTFSYTAGANLGAGTAFGLVNAGLVTVYNGAQLQILGTNLSLTKTLSLYGTGIEYADGSDNTGACACSTRPIRAAPFSRMKPPESCMGMAAATSIPSTRRSR